MATTPTVITRLDRDLKVLDGFLHDLPSLAAEWKNLEEGPRVSLSLDWDHLMADYLTELDEYYRAGQMAPEQQARYRTLLGRLRTALPVIDRLNLYRPPVPLET